MHIHLLSGLSQNVNGGVNTWTHTFMRNAASHGFRVSFSDIGPQRHEDAFALLPRLGRIYRGALVPAAEQLVGDAGRCDVLHVCVSNGPSLWRGLGLALMRAAKNQGCVVHLHSHAASCSDLSLRATEAVAMLPKVAVITPSHKDAENYPFLRHIDNFLSVPANDMWKGPSQGGKLRLVYMGWMIKRKGLHELLPALEALPDVEVTAYGPNVVQQDLSMLLEQADSFKVRDRVHYRGQLPHAVVAEYLCGYDALVMPSYEEAFGLMAVEAMALGVPVFATRGIGCLWNAPAGAYACLSPLREDRVIEVLRAHAANKALLVAMGQKGRAFVRDNLGPERILPQWDTLYESLI